MHFTETIHTGQVTFLGISAPALRSDGPAYLQSTTVDRLSCDIEGLRGDRHYGHALQSGGRQKRLYKRDTAIRNTRQWTAISTDELSAVQQNLTLSQKLLPNHIGFNCQIDGLGPITQLPPLTHLVFSAQSVFTPGRADDVVWVVYAEVLPCKIAGSAVADQFQQPALATAFPKAAMGLRGCTGYVDKGGTIKNGWYVHQLTPTYKD